MKVTILKANGQQVDYNNIQGMSVSTIPSQQGELVLFKHYSVDDVVRLPRWDWDRVLIVKDNEIEKI